MSKTVRYELDLDSPPPLTEQQQAEIRALAEMPDSAIDTSDIPPLSEKFWKNGIRNPLLKPTKTETTVRMDSDVLAWLESQGQDYHTRMNDILRDAMLRAIRRSPL
ncbi:MAG: BrnA antitoxin family protein [Alphaproteobacteria bacterium]|nr:BrnA antitoxin family protein [Alphaproteobacteria bacterium]